MTRLHALLVGLGLAALAAGCEESTPAVDAKPPVDSRTADSRTAADGRAVDRSAADRALAADTALDRTRTDGPASFPCGALLSCTTATQYCEKFSGGPCGGPDPSDAGVCPPNCNLTTCGGGKQVCLCQSFSCKALPAGCTSCGCVGASGGCTCSQTAAGAINVHCAAP